MTLAKYRAVARHIRSQLSDGRWPTGSRIPPDRELARIYGVGLNTIRNSLAELVRDGLITRRHGSGSFVNYPGPPRTRIGVLVPTLSGRFSELIAGIKDVTSAHGVAIELISFGDEFDLETSQIGKVEAAGLIVMPSLHLSSDPVAYQRFLCDLPVPVVLAERRPTLDFAHRLPYSCTDVTHGVYAAMAHLVHSGRRRIGLLSTLGTGTSGDVYNGYLKAMRDFDLPANQHAVVRRMYWRDDDIESYAAVAESERLDGIVCLSDTYAVRLQTHLGRRHLKTPDDIALVAYEDRIAGFAETPITAICPQRFDVGRIAAQILLRLLESDRAVIQANVQPVLVLRASTHPTPTGGSSWTRSAATASA